MLEYLKYYRGGYFGPNERLIIEKQGTEYCLDYVKYYQGYIENGIPFFHAVWPEARFQRWLDKLEATGFTIWKDQYYEDACDGEQWTVQYQYVGESKRSIDGSNAYPDNWQTFQALMTKIARKLPQTGFVSPDQMSSMFFEEEDEDLESEPDQEDGEEQT